MTDAPVRGGWLILASLLVALFLMVLPMPVGADAVRPQWVALITLYWCLSVPERFGVFSAFAMGLALDVVSGSLFGQHALGLSLIAYAAVELHQRIRLFPLWQQALFVWFLLLVERLLNLWVLAGTGQAIPSSVYWVPTLLGLVLWPWLVVIMNDLRRRVGVL
jgi:rod shape-determining protein MreD